MDDELRWRRWLKFNSEGSWRNLVFLTPSEWFPNAEAGWRWPSCWSAVSMIPHMSCPTVLSCCILIISNYLFLIKDQRFKGQLAIDQTIKETIAMLSQSWLIKEKVQNLDPWHWWSPNLGLKTFLVSTVTTSSTLSWSTSPSDRRLSHSFAKCWSSLITISFKLFDINC